MTLSNMHTETDREFQPSPGFLNQAITAQPQQPWLPSTPTHRQSAVTQQSQDQTDFVLFPPSQLSQQTTRRSFEAPRNPHNIPSFSGAQAQHRRHSSNVTPLQQQLPQNQRVAAIIQATGHSTSPSTFTNRFTPAQAQQFYAASAPASSAALNQQPRTRPAVPLFTQSTGNIHQGRSQQPATMAQDMDLFDDYSTHFDLGYDPSLEGQYSGSPAVPTVYDGQSMARTNSSQSNIGTVSPQDLMVRDPMSAPNSTAFTNLTSPSLYNESPDFAEQYDVSPMFQTDEISGDPWYPLFPQNSASVVEPSPVDQSPLEPAEELEVSEHLQRTNRRRSGTSPLSNKASNTAGVSARKRNQPLPPIVVEDPNDTVAMKRARNTLAARKSREKKTQRFEDLESEIERLKEESERFKEERDHWKNIALNK